MNTELLRKITNGKVGKQFSKNEFLELFDKPVRSGKDKFSIILPDGYVYKGDSYQEIRVIKNLIRNGLVETIRGQCLTINYRYKGETLPYTPDLAVYTTTKEILILEVKSVANMCDREYRKKYNALIGYCGKRRFLCQMLDRKFRTYNSILNEHPTFKVIQAIETAIANNGRFTREDLDLLISGKTTKEANKIKDKIGVYVAQHYDKIKMHGNPTYKNGEFLIIKRRSAID